MKPNISLLFGAIVGLLLACSSSPSSVTDTRPSDPPISSACPSCSSVPVASSSPPGSASSNAPVCSAWTVPSAVVADPKQCSRLSEQDNSCKSKCETRGIAWSCPPGLAYNITCFQQDKHWCCADLWCALFESGLVETGCEEGLGSYDCRQGVKFEKSVSVPVDMGCVNEEPTTIISNCCPFEVPAVGTSNP